MTDLAAIRATSPNVIEVRGEPTFQGAVRMIRWSDTDAGMFITFALNASEAGQVHPFKHLRQGSKSGQTFALVAVPITDDEQNAAGDTAFAGSDNATQPNNSPGSGASGTIRNAGSASASLRRAPTPLGQTEGADKAGHAKHKGGPLAKRAGILCNDVAFRNWVARKSDYNGIAIVDLDGAAHFVRVYCEVKSRADLDHDAEAAKRFVTLETEFMKAAGRLPEER